MTSSAIAAAAHADHAITAALAIPAAADAIHSAANAATMDVGIHRTHGRAARSTAEGRRSVATASLLHRSRPFHFDTTAHAV